MSWKSFLSPLEHSLILDIKAQCLIMTCLCVSRWETSGMMLLIPACRSAAAKRAFRLRLKCAPEKTVLRYCPSK